MIASLCVNVGLGVAWAALSQRKETLASTADLPDVAKEKRMARAIISPPAGQKTTPGATVKLDFDWVTVESEDFKKYIANLRAIGCPELTIQDIILAELDYIYEPKMNALRGAHVPVPPQKFWRDNAPSPNPQRAPNADAEIKRLFEERKALVKELLGKEEKPMRSANNYFEDNLQSRHAFLSPENLEKMHQLESKYEKLGGAASKETGYKNEEARQKMLAEMRTFLTPQEIFEYEIRTSNLSKQLRNSLKTAGLSEHEFRAVFEANYEAYQLGATGKADPQEMQAAKQKAELAVKETLGEERYTDLERSKDYSYRQLMAASSFLGYDREAALRVYAMKDDTEKAARVLAQNQNLSPEQRQKAMQEMVATAESKIQTELGASGAKYYLKSGGSWLRNLSARARIPQPASP
ncbi:MAG TPA: hypothetical protein VGH19_13670 [Verrucomicrobiae bacterium]